MPETEIRKVEIINGLIECPYCLYGQEADSGIFRCERCGGKIKAVQKNAAA